MKEWHSSLRYSIRIIPFGQDIFFSIRDSKETGRVLVECIFPSIPVLNLPFDYPRPGVLSFRGEKIEFELGMIYQENSSKSKKRACPFIWCCWPFITFFYPGIQPGRYYRGCPSAERTHPDLEMVVGHIIKIHWHYEITPKAKPLYGISRRSENQYLDAFANQIIKI